MKRLLIVNFSKSLCQNDLAQGNNADLFFYSTQKGSMIQHIRERLPNVAITLMGLNTSLKYSKVDYQYLDMIRLPSGKRYFSNILLFNLLGFVDILKQKASIVYIYSDANLYPYVGAWLGSRILNVPLYVDFRNPPRSIFNEKYTDKSKQPSLVAKIDAVLSKHIDKMFFNSARTIIHISDRSKELLQDNPSWIGKSIVIVSCPQRIFGLSNTDSVYAKKPHFIFSYWGIVHTRRELDVLIDGFRMAQALDTQFDAMLQIIGDGDDLERLKQLVKKEDIQNIRFCGYLKEQALYSTLKKSTVAVIPIPQTDFFQFSSPLKLSEAITLELPIMATGIKPNDIVRTQNLGLLCQHTNQDYAQVFLKFWKMSESELDQLRANCRSLKQMFEPDNIFNDLIECLAEDLKMNLTPKTKK